MNEEDDTKSRVYFDTRNQYIEGMNHQRDRLDIYLITFSAGVFGVSFAFITDIVGDLYACNNIFLLFASWMMFAATIIMTLFSFMKSEKSFQKMLTQLDGSYEKTGKVDSNIESSKDIKILNICSICLFGIGVITLVVFIGFNIGA
jgi:hypothetical protein